MKRFVMLAMLLFEFLLAIILPVYSSVASAMRRAFHNAVAENGRKIVSCAFAGMRNAAATSLAETINHGIAYVLPFNVSQNVYLAY